MQFASGWASTYFASAGVQRETGPASTLVFHSDLPFESSAGKDSRKNGFKELGITGESARKRKSVRGEAAGAARGSL